MAFLSSCSDRKTHTCTASKTSWPSVPSDRLNLLHEDWRAVEEVNAKVRRCYEKSDDTAYDVSKADFELPKDPQEYAERLLSDKLALVTRHYRGGPVLDLCCATGRCLRALAPRIERGFGLDFSLRYLKAAANYSSHKGTKNLAFVQGHATSIPFKSGKFAMLYCFSSLYAMPRVERAIAEISRVLRLMSKRIRDKMLDEWVSSLPGLRSIAFRHLLVCRKN